MGLPDHTELVLPIGDTILLYTTRKFSTDRLKKLTSACELTPVETPAPVPPHPPPEPVRPRPDPAGARLAHTTSSLADDIWR